MRLLCCAIIACLLFSIAFATEVSGPVSGVWDLGGSPYEVVDTIRVEAGTQLIIEPGVQVLFEGYYPLFVYGSLQALGSESDSILFEAVNPDSGWFGIRFYDNTTQPDSSILDYCILQHGKSSSRNAAGELKNGGVIYCSNASNLRISNCLITENQTGDIVGYDGIVGDPGTPGEDVCSGHGGAIYLEFSDILIANNIFEANQTGDATGGAGGAGNSYAGPYNIWGDDGGPGGTSESGDGGAIYIIDCSPSISTNHFIGNHTGNTLGGIGGEGGTAYPQVDSVFAYGGDGSYGGIAISGDGGAICSENSAGEIVLNLFDNNFSGSGTGGTGGEGGGAYKQWSAQYNVSLHGGNGGNGANGTSGGGGAIWVDEFAGNLLNNCFHNYNRTGYGSGGDGGNGGSCDFLGYFTSFGGPGGNGANGYSGSGAVIYHGGSNSEFSHMTITESLCGEGFGGDGGYGGICTSGFGDEGFPGYGVSGEGIVTVESGVHVEVTNTIIWINGDVAFSGGDLNISYCCVEGDWPGLGNIAEDPYFVDPWNDDFHLQSPEGSFHGGAWLPDENYSPCIDTGDPESPYENETDPNGNRVNMGAYGNTVEASLTYVNSIKENPTKTPLSFRILGVYPNPFNPMTTITFDLPVAAEVSLDVFDINGRAVSETGRHKTDPYAAGTHSIIFDGSHLSSGIYFYRIEAGHYQASGKLVLLK